MYRYIPLAYKSKSLPYSATMSLFINTDTWKIGFKHYEDPSVRAIITEIQFLCFILRWRKFIWDIYEQKGGIIGK